MRIAYIINSLDGYGAGAPIPHITDVMREAGAEVRVFALSRRDGKMEPLLDAAALNYEASRAGRNNHLQAADWLRQRLRVYRPTLLWTSLTQATLVGQLLSPGLGTPVVSWQHNVFLKPANLAMLRLTQRLTDLWVADSEAVAAVTRDRLKLAADDLAVWPLFAADPTAPRARRPAPGEVFQLGSLGRLHIHKGYDILIRALARLKAETPELCESFHVTIGGDGPHRREFESVARAHGITNLTFAGYQADSRRFLAGLHGYVQPSRVEGLCIAAHEAMQAGLPMVVSDTGEMPRTVQKGGAGHIVKPADIGSLANAIRALVSDRAQAARMGDAGYTYVHEAYSAARFRAAGLDIMESIERLTMPARRTA